ncbi:hypothetical protein VR44_17745 [Streptomyces katrae]|uniref:Uncharacterized protein n=1 Tax=Streptomyces katrae TaxID=68223 RepID=A0A0F4JD13_9ACTN|nr:hypothetical protein VR44_17745 [Streptomyces katrae]
MPQRVRTTAGDCAQAATGALLSDSRTAYDAPGAFGVAPDRGLVSQVDTNDAASTGWVTTARSEYDALGRVIKVSDAVGHSVTTAYSPATGPVFSMTGTDVMGHTSTVKADPGRNSPIEKTDINGRKVTAAYDNLGRSTAVWTPSQKPGTDKAAYTFSYQISEHEPPAVTSSTLQDNGTYKQTVDIYDGLLRPRQSQGEALGGGRVIKDTLYNANGTVSQTHNAYYAEGAPTKQIFVPESVFHVPNSTATAYDGLGRAVRATTLHSDVPQYSSTIQYGGDYTLSRSAMSADGNTPLPGSRASKTWTDPLGRTSAVEHATAWDLTLRIRLSGAHLRRRTSGTNTQLTRVSLHHCSRPAGGSRSSNSPLGRLRQVWADGPRVPSGRDRQRAGRRRRRGDPRHRRGSAVRGAAGGPGRRQVVRGSSRVSRARSQG